MNTAEAIVKILEEINVKYIFGHPGELIIPFYSALENSKIEHVLMRHEQGAIHGADGYARATADFGVCIATAGPGALNFTMGLAVAYKDSVPMIVITGDNPNSLRSVSGDGFQDIDINSIFKPITFKSFNSFNGKSAIMNVKKAIQILKNEPKGPIHINLPKNALLDENIGKLFNNNNNFFPNDNESIPSLNFNYYQLNNAITEIKNAKKPIILAGAGIFWGKAITNFKQFIEINNIPYGHTYHAKSLIKKSKMDLGLVGIRGTKIANYAFNNADLIIVLGSKLSERTLNTDENFSVDKNNFTINKNNFPTFKNHKAKCINVNIDKNVLSGNIKIHGDVRLFLKELNSLGKITNSLNNSWLYEIYNNNNMNNATTSTNNNININTNINNKFETSELNSENIPIKPQTAIKIILEYFEDNIIVNDAGSHTTWVNLLSEIYSNEKLIYSGAMAPMGYGLPAACGASVALAKTGEKIILINGDGGFQMNIQELATIATYNLPILIIVLNNSQLGIIRQWEKAYDNNLRYEIDLENPDFVSIANAYGIRGETVSSKKGLKLAIDDLKLDKPYLIEILVAEEDIPLSNK